MVQEAVVELVQEPKEKQVYYFTFGLGHKLAGHCQPIIASSYRSAEETMFDQHGRNWAFGYTAEEFKNKNNQVVLLKTIEGR